MTDEVNLNEILNSPAVSEVKSGNKATMVTATPTESPSVKWVNLGNYIQTNKDKIQNANPVSLDKMTGIPPGKYFLFKTDHASDADLVLFEEPATLWVTNQQAKEIRVKNSGLVIKTINSRIYAGKNNVVKVDVDKNNKVIKISTISRAKNAESVKEENEECETTEKNVDTTKLYIKKVSPRLYSKVKDMTVKEDIKKAVENYMEHINDINHLIKLEKELLYSCQL